MKEQKPQRITHLDWTPDGYIHLHRPRRRYNRRACRRELDSSLRRMISVGYTLISSPNDVVLAVYSHSSEPTDNLSFTRDCLEQTDGMNETEMLR